MLPCQNTPLVFALHYSIRNRQFRHLQWVWRVPGIVAPWNNLESSSFCSCQYLNVTSLTFRQRTEWNWATEQEDEGMLSWWRPLETTAGHGREIFQLNVYRSKSSSGLCLDIWKLWVKLPSEEWNPWRSPPKMMKLPLLACLSILPFAR